MTRNDDLHDFMKDVLLWQECKMKAEEGLPVNLTQEEKSRLFVVKGCLCSVYFIDAPGSGVIKIGKSGNVKQRLATLRSTSPVPLNLLFTIEYDDELEKRIHSYLDEYRAHGEWFYACKPVKDFIKSYMDGGLVWLVSEVGDAPDHWINYRRAISQEATYL